MVDALNSRTRAPWIARSPLAVSVCEVPGHTVFVLCSSSRLGLSQLHSLNPCLRLLGCCHGQDLAGEYHDTIRLPYDLTSCRDGVVVSICLADRGGGHGGGEVKGGGS